MPRPLTPEEQARFSKLPQSVQEWASKEHTEDQAVNPEPGLQVPFIAPEDLGSTLLMNLRKAAIQKLAGPSMAAPAALPKPPIDRVEALIQKAAAVPKSEPIPDAANMSREAILQMLEKYR